MESLPSTFQLDASRKIEPLQQGGMDNLCGLYAIVNALRLLRAPSAKQDRLLFQAGVRYLDDREWLSAVMIEGMPTRLFSALAGNLGNVEGHIVQRIASNRRSDMPEDAIMRAIVAGSPVVISVDPPLDHYSVICGYGTNRWLLFDSYGYKWLSRTQCSFGPPKNARHVIGAWIVEPMRGQPVIEEQAARQLLLPIPPTRQRSSAHNAAQSS